MCLIKEAIVEMEAHQIFQWDEIYPDIEKIRSDLSSACMYGWIEQSAIQGIIVLNEQQSPLYDQIVWKYNHPLVIHRLCIRPGYQRKGLAKELVAFAEQYGRENKYASIRLDAFVQNPFAEKLYRKLSYEEQGIISFRKGDFYCFEKKI